MDQIIYRDDCIVIIFVFRLCFKIFLHLLVFNVIYIIIRFFEFKKFYLIFGRIGHIG